MVFQGKRREGHRWKTSDAFWHSRTESEKSRVTHVLSWSPLFYLTFSALDWLVYPQHVAVLLGIRLLFAVICLLCLWIVRQSSSYSSIMKATVGAFFAGSGGIIAMCFLTDGVSSPYYVGLILCFLFAAALFSWPTAITVVSFSAPVVIYFLPVLASDADLRFQEISLQVFFLVSSLFIALIGMSTRNRLAHEAFMGQQALAQRNRELADLHELKNRMFENVSHELRTPLTLILTPLQRRLMESRLPDDERTWTSEMYRNGQRLLQQINGLLDLARLNANAVSVDRENLNVTALMMSVARDVANAARAADLTLDLEIPDQPVFYSLDPSHLEQIVLNLLSNSVKFTPPGGHIRIAVTEDDSGLGISVADTGRGIPGDQLEKIFERFQQVREKRGERRSGTGIGLSLVSELVRLMGGTVQVDSEEGKGAKFTVRFPVVFALKEESADQPAVADCGSNPLRQTEREVAVARDPDEGRMVAGKRGAKVLVVEDDARLRSQLVKTLGEDHRIVGVADGAEALREALTFRPQVVVSDVMMPKIDGIELCRRFRERVDLRETAVILLSAKGSVEDRIEGRRVGADSYLTKPFDVRELLATIEGLLRARMNLIGDYLTLEPLGRGGQSDVWLAEHRASGERVALKIIRPGGLEDEKERIRLRREHEALTRLEHPNIVRIVTRGEQSGGLFLVMEYLEGVTLDQIVRSSGALSFEAAVAVGKGMASALAHVHSSGLIHRDVKCSNVMLLGSGDRLEERVRLIDFGTARSRADIRTSRRVVGSLPYLAPELLLNTAPASPATDVFGMGVVMYRLVAGILPFQGSTAKEIMRSIEQGPALRLEEITPEIPRTLAAVIERALARDPASRWPTAREFLRAIERFSSRDVELSLPNVQIPVDQTETMSSANVGSGSTTTH